MTVRQTPIRRFVSTHSRLKAAEHVANGLAKISKVSTHSRLKAAGSNTARDVP